MYKEASYFRGMIGGNEANTFAARSSGDAGVTNKGGLITPNSHYIRKVKDVAPAPSATTWYPAYLISSVWSHPANTQTGTSWQTFSQTLNTGGLAPNGGTGRWVWLIRNVENWYSDFQMNDFNFYAAVGGDADGNIPNTTSAQNAVFETHTHDPNFDDIDNDTQAKIETAYNDKIAGNDSYPFYQVTTGTTNSRWNTSTTTPPSSGTGINDGTNSFVYYEASGNFGGGNASFLRTEEITYGSGQGAGLIFSYAIYSSTPAAVGEVKLWWVVEN